MLIHSLHTSTHRAQSFLNPVDVAFHYSAKAFSVLYQFNLLREYYTACARDFITIPLNFNTTALLKFVTMGAQKYPLATKKSSDNLLIDWRTELRIGYYSASSLVGLFFTARH